MRNIEVSTTVPGSLSNIPTSVFQISATSEVRDCCFSLKASPREKKKNNNNLLILNV